MLNINDIIELKALIKEIYNEKLHAHDTCSGMYFSFDVKINGIKNFINKYLKKKQLKAKFSDDCLSFTVHNVNNC